MPWIKRCVAAGVATEVELGRLEGGEAGLRQIEGTIMTDPTKAEEFMKQYVSFLLRMTSLPTPEL